MPSKPKPKPKPKQIYQSQAGRPGIYEKGTSKKPNLAGLMTL
jgi:hypothetical protein